MTTATAPTTTTSSSCVILPSDFSHTTRDKDRDTWTPAKLALVIAALDGAPCIITTERTGHTLVGVQLTGIGGTYSRSGQFLYVKSTYSDGTDRTTHYPLFGLPKGSAIIPLPGGKTDAKWDATKHLSDLTTAVGNAFRAQHPDWYGTTWCGYTFDATLTRCSIQFASQCWGGPSASGRHYSNGAQHDEADCPTPTAAELTYALIGGEWVETDARRLDWLPAWFTARPRP